MYIIWIQTTSIYKYVWMAFFLSQITKDDFLSHLQSLLWRVVRVIAGPHSSGQLAHNLANDVGKGRLSFLDFGVRVHIWQGCAPSCPWRPSEPGWGLGHRRGLPRGNLDSTVGEAVQPPQIPTKSCGRKILNLFFYYLRPTCKPLIYNFKGNWNVNYNFIY